MIKIKHIKLKVQLRLLVILSIIVMIIIETFYYYGISAVIQKRAELYTTNLLEQVTQKISSYSERIMTSSEILSYNKYVQQFMSSENPVERINLYPYITDIFYYVGTSNENIENILLVSSNNSTSTFRNINPFMADKIIKTINNFNPHSRFGYFTDLIKADDYNYYYGYRNSIFLAQPDSPVNKKIGYCMVLGNIEKLSSILSKLSLTKHSLFLILDSKNNVMALNNDNAEFRVGTVLRKSLSKILNFSSKPVIKTFDGKVSLIQSQKIKYTNWKAVSIIPASEINDDLMPIRNYGVVIIFIMGIVLISIGILITNNITKPIDNIISFLNMVPYNNLEGRLKVDKKNELDLLSFHINNMLDEIKEMTKKIFLSQSSLYEMEIEKKQAQLISLQNQINPHFLYNTLDCIKGIASVYKSQEIIDITLSLTDILRYSIKGNDFVSVKDEINCIKNYLNIISIRFPMKHEYNIQIDKELMNYESMKLILQPLVENSIYHGLERIIRKGQLDISGFITDDNLIHFEITDNGKGINNEKLIYIKNQLEKSTSEIKESSGKSSIGLINVNNRLKQRYGKQYGLKIFSTEDIGTTVIIEFPAIKKI